MSYVVLARKYRPQTLDALAGQQHIARALSNAIAMDRVAHAFLFCGARGTGKTSTARILAKMLNCEQGPTATPCGVCAACTEIAAGTSIDVHELDAASNRGINEIRELREGVGYAPARDRHKVYIIDEVHMLTTEAANAFLKTLEEPPAHAIFILATTDPQRLPVTIRSRCQRYDFRRIRAGEVVSRLREICASEGVEADDEALFLVAREGEGSMRDALSVLDQVIAFGGEKLDAQAVAGVLGVADRQRIRALLGALVVRDALAAVQAVGAAHGHGVDLRTFARTMAMEARDALVVRLSGKVAEDLVDRAPSELEQLAETTKPMPTAELERLSHVLLELAESVARARYPRLVLEMGVVRLCRAAPLADVAALAARVERLVLMRGPGGGGPGGGGGRGGPGTDRAGTGSGRAGHGGGPGGGGFARGGGSSAGPRAQASRAVGNQQAAALAGHAAPHAATSRPQPHSEAAPARAATDADLNAWRDALDAADRPELGRLLEHAVVHRSVPGEVVLGFANRFHRDNVGVRDAAAQLGAALATLIPGTWRVSATDDLRARTESPASRSKHEAAAEREARLSMLRDHVSVQRVRKAFDGQIVDIHLAGAEQDPAQAANG